MLQLHVDDIITGLPDYDDIMAPLNHMQLSTGLCNSIYEITSLSLLEMVKAIH